MISIETYVFDKVVTHLETVFQDRFPNLRCATEVVREPASFPFVSFVEMNNATYTRSLTEQPVENHVSLMYEINVYDNDRDYRKQNCQDVFAEINQVLTELYFTRTYLQPIQNMDDATIYRLVGRYTVVTNGRWLYRE